ncbi:MAG: sensor domain-containing diguanylate cyclase [Sulfuricurvum sp.]|nr:sensor domain-containing diguanylate cyclase [Sulfuricurvum sp.]
MREEVVSLQNTLIQLKALEDFNQTLKSDHTELLDYIRVMEEYVYTTKTDIKGTITDVSDSFCRLTGFTREEFVGKNHNLIRHDDMDKQLFKELWETISDGDIWEGDIQSVKKDGTSFWMRVVIFPRYNIDKELIGYASIRHNITDAKQLESEVIHDSLTGLYNRRYYDEIIERELMRSKREKAYFTFVMMDIDFFKLYNDTYGHRKGDHVLREVGKVLQKRLNRGSDFCFRLGGEEFGFFFINESLEASIFLTEGICKAIEALRIPHSKNKASPYVTASFGLVNVNMQTAVTDEQALYTAADNALYKAKEAGRNRVVIFESGDMELF